MNGTQMQTQDRSQLGNMTLNIPSGQYGADGAELAANKKGELCKCEECGRHLRLGERVYYRFGRMWGRENECVQTHGGNWQQKVANAQARRAEKANKQVAKTVSIVAVADIAQPNVTPEMAAELAKYGW